MRLITVVLAMLAVGFGSSFAGHIGGVFLAGGAPLLALGLGVLVLGIVIILAVWAVRHV